MHSLLLAVASTLTLASAEPTLTAAPIPIDGPITISQSGDYIVTQDFSAVGVAAIQFSGSATITAAIDFDGHKVVGSIILRRSGELGTRTLTIKNGQFEGFISAVTGHGFGWSTISMDNMTHTSVGTNLEDGSFVATHCRFVNANIFTDANFGSPLLQLEDSDVISGDLNGWGSRCRIVGNDIQNGSILFPTSDGFTASGLIAGNVVHNGSIDVGRAPGTSSRLQILGNDVSGYIRLRETWDALVYGNVIRGCLNGVSITINDFSRRNQIVRNELLGGCDHGLYFGNITRDNVYTDNDFRFPVLQPIVDLGDHNHPGPSVDAGPE